jgi:antagonist of KipI
LSVGGGFNIPIVLNSAATYLRAGLGGFKGRALEQGDQLEFGTLTQQSQRIFSRLKKNAQGKTKEGTWTISKQLIPNYSANATISVIKGRQFQLFSSYSQTEFFTRSYRITPQSDRMGYRLSGPPLKLKIAEEMVSEAVAFGTIQVPGDGQPIILLADRQTTGGYPKIAQIASVDFPKVAQLKPGDTLSFQEISLNTAQHRLLEQEERIQELKRGIALKYI